MRNLSIWDVCVKELDFLRKDVQCISYGHDESNASELYVCSDDLVLRCFSENGKQKWKKDLSNVVSRNNRPVNVTYLSLTDTICLGFDNGELLTVTDSGATSYLTGVFDSGLLAMEWSPDQELLSFVTKEMKSVIMSCTYDPMYEECLLSQEFGGKQFITVGWGKKETQFHGSEGKGARVKAKVDADPTFATSDKIKITWRGDGHLYAIGFTMDGIRRFKVFDRQGQLQYTSEKQPGLEANICWRPSGNVIATTQKLPDKLVVAFFEKNGLKHGGFDVPVNAATVVEDIQWSFDSEIITLQCRDTNTGRQKLLLFTTGNYHWYLKQTVLFNEDQKIVKLMWNTEFDVQNNKKLHVMLKNGQHISYNWIWNIDQSRGKGTKDDAVIAVIDGTKLKVTGFRQTAIPPPMAACELQLHANINSVHFAPPNTDLDTNSFFVITDERKFVFFEQTNKFPLDYRVTNTFSFPDYDFPFQYYNWHWINHNTILCSKTETDKNCKVYEYRIELADIVRVTDDRVSASVLRIVSHPLDSSIAFLQLDNGNVIKYTVGGNIEPAVLSFANVCPKFSVFSIDNELHYIGLSYRGNLHIDGVMVMTSVSSFFIHSDFLLLTTLQHMLLCSELTESGLNGIIEYSKVESPNVYKRKIERGAKLVTVVPENTRTVFQMPRGNLETIQPRPLTLKIVGKYLDSLNYNEAFKLMRKERINLNLIHDHNPDKFMKHIVEFLESIESNSWLSLFLSDLENIDVTKTMYSSSYADRTDTGTDKNNGSAKILEVCKAVRLYINKRSDVDSRVLPLITSFVKTNVTSDLEEALRQIKTLKERETNGAKLPVGSDEALKYLLYMVDVSKLFDVALGMYDFDLVLQVATKSQKDPKEYVAMLNEFNEMDENYRKFSINKHLKRFGEAIKCLVKCGPTRHEELKTFVKYHSLYSETLSLFTSEEEVYKQISEDFGLHLKLQKQFTEAGVIYQRGGKIDKAIECYKDALEWELAISLAYSWPKEQFQALCWDLANALKDEKRHTEALTILQQYYDDKEETILYAINNGQYKSACRLCSQYGRDDLRENNLLPALLDEHRNLQELVEANLASFIKYRDRLRVVREIKKQNPIGNYDQSYDNRDYDLYSDAGSTLASSSRGSSRSYRSSKNRRKHERKVCSLKEGSRYEDVALVMALHSLVAGTFDLRAHVGKLNVTLASLGKDKQAFVLQTSLEKLLKEMKDSLREIWSHELMLEATNASIAAEIAHEGTGAITPQGIVSLEAHMRMAPIIQDISWKLDGLY